MGVKAWAQISVSLGRTGPDPGCVTEGGKKGAVMPRPDLQALHGVAPRPEVGPHRHVVDARRPQAGAHDLGRLAAQLTLRAVARRAARASASPLRCIWDGTCAAGRSFAGRRSAAVLHGTLAVGLLDSPG